MSNKKSTSEINLVLIFGVSEIQLFPSAAEIFYDSVRSVQLKKEFHSFRSFVVKYNWKICAIEKETCVDSSVPTVNSFWWEQPYTVSLNEYYTYIRWLQRRHCQNAQWITSTNEWMRVTVQIWITVLYYSIGVHMFARSLESKATSY